MHPHSGIYVNSTVSKKLSVAEELEKIEWQMSTQLANLRLLIQEVHRNDISESPAEKMPVGVVNVDTVHRVIDTDVERPTKIDASFLENEGTGAAAPQNVGRNMNEEY